MFGASIDNMLDVNCDNIGDIIVGEPLSTAVPLLGADVVGGSAYVYLGKPDGTYQPAPIWDLHAEVSSLLGVNATSLLGFSVAGAGHTKGSASGVRSLVGGPSNRLDFGIGLLNLGNTLGTTFNLVFDQNGIGKAYSFSFTSCNITLPVTLLNFSGHIVDKTVQLQWETATEDYLQQYELERSTDGIHFEDIALYFPAYKAHNMYGYPDKHPANGFNYYRLKMTDHDGKARYSNIVALKFTEALPGDMVIAPNPAQGDIHVRFTGMSRGIYRLSLHNSAGQEISNQYVSLSHYSENLQVQFQKGLSSGIYVLNLYDQNGKLLQSSRVIYHQ
ncbi:MAG: T9SS type A sorting domain-containing protein [Chitinophagaceae bacterium]|nr:T9SS type A sorting domain-containing protein [Chitinophagaceae bacterium]